MSTLVFVHAHPDDEATLTGGTMALAHRRGHRVVSICCTDGSLGTPEGSTLDTEAERAVDRAVAEVRRREAAASAEILGVDRLVFLDHRDSGMTGWASNDDPEAFMNADPARVGQQIAVILDEEDADVLIGYDWHGNYGHPDHVMVHRVVAEALTRARRTPRLLQATMNRDAMRERHDPNQEHSIDPDAPADDGNPFGTPEAELAWSVDVSEVVMVKRQALSAHASQSDAAGLLAMPEELWALGFAREYYIEDGVAPLRQGWPFDPAAG